MANCKSKKIYKKSEGKQFLNFSSFYLSVMKIFIFCVSKKKANNVGRQKIRHKIEYITHIFLSVLTLKKKSGLKLKQIKKNKLKK